MDLSIVITYLALLITAYLATQEYMRLKLRLTRKIYLILFCFTLGLLYLSAFSFTRELFIQIKGLKELSSFFGESKYFVVMTLNLSLLVLIMRSAKLAKHNDKTFLELIHALKANKNWSVLHELIADNTERIFKLRFMRTFKENSMGQVRISFISDILELEENKKRKFPEVVLEHVKLSLNKLLVFFSYRKEIIYEIFEQTISDEIVTASLVENGEHIGWGVFEVAIKYKQFSISFVKRFLASILKKKESYYGKQFLCGGDNSVANILLKHQDSKEISLSEVILLSIFELIAENSELMQSNYKDLEENKTVTLLESLLYSLTRLNPDVSFFSNYPYYIVKDLLKNINSEGTVAFHILQKLYFDINYYERNRKQETDINILNYLFSSFSQNTYSFSSRELTELACPYMYYLFGSYSAEDKTKVSLDYRVDQFRKLFNDNNHYGTFYSKNIFIPVFRELFSVSRRRGLCEDSTGFGYDANEEIRNAWNKLANILKEQ